MNLLSNAVKYTPEGGTIQESESAKNISLIYLKHLAVKKVHQKAVL